MLSVVIPVYNSANTLAAQLDALSQQTFSGPWELVLADNGSTDGSTVLAARWQGRIPNLRVVDASDRRGATYARNVGLAAAAGDFIVFCDADDVVTPAWLEQMAGAARYGEVVAGRLDDEPLNPPERRWRGAHKDSLGVCMEFMPYAVSANFGAWATVFEALGGWSEDFPHGADDVDFSWRAQLAGYRIHFASKAIVRYRYRDSVLGNARQARDYGRGDCLLYERFRSQGIPHRPLHSLMSSVTWLVTRSPFLVLSRRRRGFWVGKLALLYGRVSAGVERGFFFA
jgi:glycosyltransferase involved in cell wall biosynthesis